MTAGWNAVKAALPVGLEVECEVVTQAPFGVFVRIRVPGTPLGLIERTDFATDHGTPPAVGDVVVATVIGYRDNDHQIALTLRPRTSSPQP